MTLPDRDLPGPALEDLDRDAALLAYDSRGRHGFQRRVLRLYRLDPTDPNARVVGGMLQVVDPLTHLCFQETVDGPDWADLARRNATYLRLEDRLWQYRIKHRLTRARHRRTGRIRIKLVGGPAHGRQHDVAASGPDAHPPMMWQVRDLRPLGMAHNLDTDPVFNGGSLVNVAARTLVYRAGMLLDEDMIWPYRYAGPLGAGAEENRR
jgi:hypothetical protein